MKRLFCIILAMMVIVSAFALTASAAQTTFNTSIYLQVPTAKGVEWKNFSRVFCHIWRDGKEGGDFFPWQGKGERCTDLGNGYWSYDLSQFDFDSDGKYYVIFSNENGLQTYNLSLTSACKGDIVICDGDTCTNPVDSEKTCTVARWMNNSDTVHPVAQIGSDGLLVDPDGINNTDVDLTWGSSEGMSVELPEVEDENETQISTTDTDNDALNPDSAPSDTGLNIILIVAVIAVVVIAAVVIVLAVVSKKRKK